MMEMIVANESYREDCIVALRDSELGRQYFPTKSSQEYAIDEGLKAGTLYVALENEEFMGFLFYIRNGAFHSFPYIHLIVTKESTRGCGVGTKMLKAIETITNRPKIFLVVSDFNPEAKKFYERNGYVQVGCMPNLYRPGITEYLMMKECNI